MQNIAIFLKTFSNENRAKLQALGFAIVGVMGVGIVDRAVISIVSHDGEERFWAPFVLGTLFFILSSVFLYILLRRAAKITEDALVKLSKFQKEEKDRLQLFNFALDNSADAIYWFTFDTKFFYVNDATCKMLGYTKNELLSMKLSDVDPDYEKNTPDFLEQIKQKRYICFETEQLRKDRGRFSAAISANYFCDGEREFICAFGRDVNEQKEKERIILRQNNALKSSLSEKEVLIKEIHHRVKNNLEIVSSLLQMQNRREENEKVRSVLIKSQSRIYAMAMVHEMLYKNSDLSTINMGQYLTRLSGAMIELYAPPQKITVSLDTDDIYLGMDYAMLTALIIHELFLNSIKHAFCEVKEGSVEIFIKNSKNGKIVFGVADSGKGFLPNEISATKSLGWQLINSIAEFQLDGEIAFELNNCFKCSISFLPKYGGDT